MLLSLRVQHEKGSPHLIWIAGALVVMGLWDGVHAVAPFGVAWSWLRHGATLVGGLLFGLVWLRLPAAVVRRRQLGLLMVGLAALAAALGTWRWADLLPAPFLPDGYSSWVKVCNAAGGLGFLAAAAFFLKRYLGRPHTENLVFASQALLFSVAALFFGYSHLWGPAWWAWHVFRLLAYALVLIAAYKILAALYQQTAAYAQDLERRTAELGQTISALEREMEERTRAEAGLRQASLYARSLLEASLDPLVTIRKDGKIMDVNRATEEATGVGRERLIGSDFCDYFTEPERARQGYEQVFSQGQVEDYSLAIRHVEGRVTEVLYNATVFQNEHGQVEGVFAAARDVTARRRAERELERLNRALEAVSQCNQALIHASDETSLLQEVCEIIVRVTGYRLAWIGYKQDDGRKTVRPMARAGQEADYLEIAHITWADDEHGHEPSGSAIRTAQTFVTEDATADPRFAPWREQAVQRGFRGSIGLPLVEEGRAFGALAVYAHEPKAFDTTEVALLEQLACDLSFGIATLRMRILQKGAEEQVRALNAELEDRVRQRTAELEETNRELESFTYSVSHDLRAPLRHVDGFSKILLDEYGPTLNETARRYLERVRQGTQFMGRLVDDLLNLSRVGRRELSVQITGLGTLVEEIRKELAAEVEGREVEWRIGDLPYVECDPGLMKQVLTNLLSNALKFTRPRPRAVIEVGQQPGEGAPVIFVRDNGVGFNMKYADKLFGIFQRLHRQEDFEGTGVGLATVERILHKHGGRIWAEAELDKGATFYFTLGAAEVSAEQPAAQEVAA